MNCLPFLGLESKVRVMGGFSVTIYDRSVREMACGLFERGLGYKAAARRLGIPPRAVRKWQQMYRAVGRGGLLGMGRAKARYDYGTKVAAARAVVDGGMSKPEAMERFGVASISPLESWCSPIPRGRSRSVEAQAEGQAAQGGHARDARGGGRARGPQTRGPGGVPKKIGLLCCFRGWWLVVEPLNTKV